jgi:hypothetical protein
MRSMIDRVFEEGNGNALAGFLAARAQGTNRVGPGLEIVATPRAEG